MSRNSKAAVVSSLSAVPSIPIASPLVPPLLVSVKEAARLLGLESQSVRRLARSGDLRYRKISSTKWLISMKSIEIFASKLVAA
jgi:excisionase family DNA binding protein